MHRRLDVMRASNIPVAQPRWRRTGASTAVSEWRLQRPEAPTVVRLGENIASGQRVARFTVEGKDATGWRRIAAGTTIGYCKLERIAVGPALTHVRLLVEDAVAPPEAVSIELFGGG
jgi:alpha-L-fucosidase